MRVYGLVRGHKIQEFGYPFSHVNLKRSLQSPFGLNILLTVKHGAEFLLTADCRNFAAVSELEHSVIRR